MQLEDDDNKVFLMVKISFSEPKSIKRLIVPIRVNKNKRRSFSRRIKKLERKIAIINAIDELRRELKEQQRELFLLNQIQFPEQQQRQHQEQEQQQQFQQLQLELHQHVATPSTITKLIL